MKTIMSSVTFLLSITAIASNAAPPKEKEHSVINNAGNKAQEEKYWTEDRLKNAIPLPLPEVSDEKLEQLLKGKREKKRNDEDIKIKSQEGSDAKTLTPGIPVMAKVNEYPFSSGGVLFFTKPNGKDYQCTAEFSGQNNILLTAAHCLRDGKTGHYYTNFRFRRAYSNGGGQHVGWNCLFVYHMWFNPPENHKYDYGFIQTDSTSGAGWLGWKTGIPASTWTAIGYPKNYGNNQYMYEVGGDKGPVSSGIVQMNNNPMNKGASGGSWIEGSYAIGLNSFIVPSNPGKMWGPLFDDEFVTLYKMATKECQ